MNLRFLIVLTAFAAAAASAGGQAQPVSAPDPAKLKLASANALVIDADTQRPLYAKGADEVTPIASLTKLMTAIVTLDSGASLDEALAVDMGDFDFLKGSHSRLRMGSTLSRDEMLKLALMSSENRAASTLARHYPGGTPAFVEAMNAKAALLGLSNTRFEDPTGLSPRNVSTATDLARMVQAAAMYPVIRAHSTTPAHFVEVQPTGQMLGFNNSNALVKSGTWDIQLQKTGYIREAGRCVVMLATVASRPMVIVLLDSIGKVARMGDAQRVKYWLETGESMPMVAAKPAVTRAVKGARPAKAAAPTRVASSTKGKRA